MRWPIVLCITDGQMSDRKVVKLLYPALPSHARTLIRDKGYDSDDYRAAITIAAICLINVDGGKDFQSAKVSKI